MHANATTSELALYGGTPLRTKPYPGRRQFGEDELEAVREVFEHSWKTGRDFGYQTTFEDRYTRAFSEFLGGGYTDAVSTGSASVMLAIMALELPKGSQVVVSPVTDPGAIGAVLMLGYEPVVADSAPGSFSMGSQQLEAAIGPRVSAAVVTHMAGIPTDIDKVAAVAKARGIKLVEDCSHAHGASLNGVKVGTFGDINAFSTMFSKNHSSGGCGGLVFTKSEALYWKARACADRGKPFHTPGMNDKDPTGFMFASLNFNQDELSSAIGMSTLKKLPEVIRRRNELVDLIKRLMAGSRLFRFQQPPPNSVVSPFFLTVIVDSPPGTKLRVAKAVAAEGVPVNPDYRYVVAEWPWFAAATGREWATPNATAFRETSFNILFHERFADEDAADIAECLQKVERHLSF